MDADIQIMVGTVQTDCQVCDSATLSFLTHSLRHLCQSYIEYFVVFPFTLLPCFGAEAGAEGLSQAVEVSLFQLAQSSHYSLSLSLYVPRPYTI